MLTANDADVLGVPATKVARRAGYRVILRLRARVTLCALTWLT